MEKGMVRCDVNVSVRPVGTKELGAKIEIKNMNSFSGVRRALEYEIPRQIEVLNKGGKLIQSTRRWDDVAGVTEEMRTKEHAHDYRYFPEPDLMPFAPTEKWLAEVKSRVVELPLARKQRFMRDYGLPASDAQTFVWDVPLGNYFEGIARQAKNPKAVANWVINNLRAKLAERNDFVAKQIAEDSKYGKDVVLAANEARSAGVAFVGWKLLTLSDLMFKPSALLELIGLVDAKTISSSAAQQVFAEMFDTGKSPSAIVQEKGLAQVSDAGAIEAFCDEAIAANPNAVADYRGGRVAALNALKGQVMKLSKGKANPAVVGEILERKLKA
jgi:aspartyl-tRNA(Asn)/glutamyl-tRNA(Gln) amidotransferase subunit B